MSCAALLLKRDAAAGLGRADVVSMSEDRVISGMTGWEDPAQPGLQCNPTDNKPSGTSITLLWRSTATPAGYLWRELCRNFPIQA